MEAIWVFFDLPELGSFSPSFADSGYDYIFLVENMGNCFFLVQFYVIWCSTALLVGALVYKCKVFKLKKTHEKLKKDLFWSVALRFVFESYLELSICVTVGLLNL